ESRIASHIVDAAHGEGGAVGHIDQSACIHGNGGRSVEGGDIARSVGDATDRLLPGNGGADQGAGRVADAAEDMGLAIGDKQASLGSCRDTGGTIELGVVDITVGKSLHAADEGADIAAIVEGTDAMVEGVGDKGAYIAILAAVVGGE